MNDDDLALGHVLRTLDEGNETRARDLAARDPAFTEAVARATRDVKALEHGIRLVAVGATAQPRAKRSTRRYALLGAAAAVLAVIGGIVLASRDGGKVPVADPLGTSPATLGVQVPRSLQDKVHGAAAIVVGTVTEVRTGSIGMGEGDEQFYAMATIRVQERIAGSTGDDVVAFDYVYGGVTSIGGIGGVWAEVGQRMLVFLVSDAGTISEDLEPAHLQVLDGAGGRFLIRDGELVDAPFTLDEVRQAAGA